MPGPIVDILMYHSISDGRGPTCISRAVFAQQMAALAEAGTDVITLDDFVSATAGAHKLKPHSVIITFDDGFTDFETDAWSILKEHGFSATVYLPTAHVGKSEDWVGASPPYRQLMGWDTIQKLAEEGVVFGSHTINHSMLTRLDDAGIWDELDLSKSEMETKLGQEIYHFAPPYGLTNSNVCDAAARIYRTSVGTRFGRANETSLLSDLPRLEMFYYTNISRWREHLGGRGTAYFLWRKLMRQVGKLVQAPWQ